MNFFQKVWQGVKDFFLSYVDDVEDHPKEPKETYEFNSLDIISPNQSAKTAKSDSFYSKMWNDVVALQNANRESQIAQNNLEREYQKQSAADAMAFSAAEAQKNRDWQEMMSNTAYQRATADMRSAGINPILAYSQGGATSPSGSSGTGYTVGGGSNVALDVDTMSDFLNTFVSSAAALTGDVVQSIARVLR